MNDDEASRLELGRNKTKNIFTKNEDWKLSEGEWNMCEEVEEKNAWEY